MNRMRHHLRIRRILALLAIGFGFVTIFAGGRVLLGADPGYAVFKPLLIYNAGMGFVYIAAGGTAWLSVVRGRQAAAAIFGVNLLVLAAIVALYATSDSVAIESVRAMTLRTVVWLALFVGFMWLGRSSAGEVAR